MNDTSRPRRFAVTTSGLSATRWLSQVLVSHPDVFVAHGKFALDAVAARNFEHDKTAASLLSLTRGNDLRAFYDSHSVEEVFAAYEQIRPYARAWGCVHSYTVHTLAMASSTPDTLDRMRILNVVRHPVSFLASHFGLVRAAEGHPQLYGYYLNEIFPHVLQQFPELFLLPCADFRAFLAFAVSCQAVGNMVFDLCYPGVGHQQMEALTTRSELLRQVCEELTGLPYAVDKMEEFVRQGAINRHRIGPACPAEIYDAWEPWQRDMANLMIAPLVLDWFESLGYDVALLRQSATPKSSETNRASCLADYLRSLDPRHPLLEQLTPTGTCRAHTIDSDYQGFQWARQGDHLAAWARSLEITDISTIDADTRDDMRHRGLYLESQTQGAIWKGIARIISDNPSLLGECGDHNVIRFRGICYAVMRGHQLDLERLGGDRRRELINTGKLIVLAGENEVQKQIDDGLWQLEMRRQQGVVAGWHPVRRWLWNSRKKLGRLKHSLMGRGKMAEQESTC
jgi:hypothetical protein